VSLLDEYSAEEIEVLLEHATEAEAEVILRALEVELVDDRYFPGARDEQQIPPDPWGTWALMGGRGLGKTRTGAEWIVAEALEDRGFYAVAAPTYGDGRDICIEGESGVRSVLQRRGRWSERRWNRSLGELRLDNGSLLKVGSADEPERFRGWNFKGAWCDELGSWRRPDAWTQLRLATRLGRSRIVATMTPRATKLVRSLLERPNLVLTRGSTYDNAANLSAEFLDEVRATYEGTRIGRQELLGELLLDTPGALWTDAVIEAARRTEAPELRRVVVAIDPAVTNGEDSDATGIIAAGVDYAGDVWVLADRTCRLSPDAWCRRAVALYDEVEGDRIVAEVNNGGDLVATVLHAVDPTVPYKAVHASRGKRVRAEPVAALYEQGRVHHVGVLAELEEQMTTWTPESGESPDRLDALVWAVTDLAIEQGKRRRRSIVATGAVA
jgi:phage terminase large subunit-like protein